MQTQRALPAAPPGLFARAACLCLTLLLALTGAHALSGELPVETFFRHFEHDDASLSPDGKCVAVRAPVEGRYGLAVIDLASRTAKWAHGDQRADVTSLSWATSDRLLFTVGKDGYRWSGLFSVGKDGSRLRTVIGFGDPRAQMLCLIPNSPGELLVTSYAENSSCPDVHRVNT
jgi:hypothetical protein